MRKLCVFDIEVLPNCFICCCRISGQPIVTFEISARKFQLKELVAFFTQNKHVFVGYNCIHYDTPIMNMLIMRANEFQKSKSYRDVTSEAFKLSHTIINGDPMSWRRYKYGKNFAQLDLMTMMASQALRVGLKSLQVTMCYPNVKEMKVKWSEEIQEDKIDDLIFYCHNDVGSTGLLLYLLKDDIALRKSIQGEFEIDCLSKDGVGIGVDIFTKFVCAQLGILPKELSHFVSVPDIIDVQKYIQPCIEFKTKPFQDLLAWYKTLVISLDEAEAALRQEEEDKSRVITTWEDLQQAESDKKGGKYKRTVLMNNLAHSFALGGVHSINKPIVHEATVDYILRDEDVESFYPSLALAYGFGPDGFRDVFLKVMQFMKDERVVAKLIAKDKSQPADVRAKANLKNEAFKLALNSILGNLKNKYSPYYAPHMNVAICVNGQLMLAMLIETCELAGIECISSNTDGATFKIHKSKVKEFEQICADWKAKTKMKLETALYEKMVIYAVNDYIAFKTGYSEISDKVQFMNPFDAIRNPKGNAFKVERKGEMVDTLPGDYVKEKGMFITTPRLGKGLDSLIIPKAIQNYYGKGIPVEETIRNAMSVWDFVSFQKVGKQYTVKWNGEEQQHINRYYVSKKGAYLFKEKPVEKYQKKYSRMETVLSQQNMLKGFGVQLINEYEDKPMVDYNIDYRYYVYQANKIINQLEPIQQTLF